MRTSSSGSYGLSEAGYGSTVGLSFWPSGKRVGNMSCRGTRLSTVISYDLAVKISCALSAVAASDSEMIRRRLPVFSIRLATASGEFLGDTGSGCGYAAPE